MSLFLSIFLASSFQSALGTSCWDEFECSNETIIEMDSDDIDCHAFGACYKSSLTVMDSINITDGSDNILSLLECRGLRGCQNTDITVKKNDENGLETVNVDVEMTGYLSLAFASDVYIKTYDDNDDDSNLYCYGEASCYGITTISAARSIYCSGARSCSDIGSAYVTNIYGDGTFALKGSNFYSYSVDNSNEIEIELYGYYSGFGASFWCREGYTCNVDCGDNGCVNFNYYCDDNAVSCDVICGDDFLYDTYTVCPNGWSSTGEYTGDFDTSMFEAEDYSFVYTNDLIDALYNKVYSSDIYYEETNECPNNDQIGTDIGCPYLNDYITCSFSGYLGDVTDDMCANGGTSIGYSSINMTGEDSTLYCNGGRSCVGTTINLHGNDVYCRGDSSCGDFKYFNNIIATAYDALLLDDVMNGGAIGCFADDSCYGADITNVTTIYASGSSALGLSEIITNGRDLDVYLLGYGSGIFMDITCSGTDTCTIYGLNKNYGGIWEDDVVCDASDTCTIKYVVIDQSSDGGESDGSDGNIIEYKKSILLFSTIICFLII